ncbi:uncharacterized protein C8Q71DRAFT_855664 [Rhodofomes roseus]|uniref:Uncharacterized protein n=1 Tax=Rhodofomes roseus TaxID=34475 RepID=A0ABQ8KL27_9APHY|nr:uncharacterized protein C8Q71DRAFT_855664 [Rhodofomes roseus]KAH9839012.1 hypothetical protein C8Q71DRAFT_855664 [Rhodofomes roseus]
MPYAWDVYAQELLPLGHGYPLWDPRPDETAGEIEIGDVGYIEDGRFRRLFNPTLPRDDPANCAWGVPKDFRPLEIGNLITEEQRTLGDDILSCRHVTHAEVNAKVEVESAADLALNYDRDRVLRCTPSTIMHDYLLKNYKAWHHYLHHQQKLKLSKKDLVFVHGYTKTAKWAGSAFQNTSKEESAKIGGGHGPAQTSFSIDLSMKESLGGWTNVGLDGKTEKMDQCIFVQHYQYTTRDGFKQWLLRHKTSFENIIGKSPKQRSHDCDEDEEDQHIDKKRRIDAPKRESEDSNTLLRLKGRFAEGIFRNGSKIDIAVMDTEDLAKLLEEKVTKLESEHVAAPLAALVEREMETTSSKKAESGDESSSEGSSDASKSSPSSSEIPAKGKGTSSTPPPPTPDAALKDSNPTTEKRSTEADAHPVQTRKKPREI